MRFLPIILLTAAALPAQTPRDLVERGMDLFIKGRVTDSIVEFDRAAALAPDLAPHLWQRGIAHYYAGRFEDGRRQFETHRTVNPDDVENAAWWYLCMARLGRRDEARARLLPVGPDSRVPMSEIYALYSGAASEEAILAAATRGDASPPERRLRLFYAHLYLGLYAEAHDRAPASVRHIRIALNQKTGGYMWEVARIHLEQRRR